MRKHSLRLAPLPLLGIVASAAVIASCVAPPVLSAGSAEGASRCATLVGQKIGGAVVEKADYIPAGGATIAPIVKAAHDVCRVSARAEPVPGSNINMRMWLPANWNGKMLGIGGAGMNGGFAAEWFLAAPPMNAGYAIFVTDAGHEVAEDDAKWAFGQPEKVKDYGYRANHEGALATKAVVASYYGQSPSRSYFHGCSNGGRDALIQAQRYPQDWDGIVAGAPANDWTGIMTTFLRTAQIAEPHRRAGLLGPKIKLLHDAAVKQCDAADGVADALISDPTNCQFDPAVLQCKSASTSGCLSASEVASVRTLYDGVRNRAGELIMPGFPPGSELDWSSWFTRPDKQTPGMAQEVFRYMVYDDPSWSWTTFDLDRDHAALERKLAATIDATDPDLRPFARQGGKLLMYQGSEDAAVPAGSSIRYFEAVRAVLGTQSDDAQLFMVPGMAHCFAGTGPNVVDFVGALDKWVEGGNPPDQLTSSKHDNLIAALTGGSTKVLQTRPVCAWPKTPHYRGDGAVDKEASYVCR